MACKPHPDQTPIKRSRDGNTHIDACAKGYLHGEPRADWSTYANIHHIVCISAVADGTIEEIVDDDDQFDFIQDCLEETDWDINAEPNTIGLPKKPAYVDKRASRGYHTWACHQVDHDLYLDQVSTKLNTTVWSICQGARKSCKVTGKKIATQLTQESKYWLGQLSSRATVAAWASRKKNKKWHIPFSMYPPGARGREAPPDWLDDYKPSMVSKLSELFEMVAP